MSSNDEICRYNHGDDCVRLNLNGEYVFNDIITFNGEKLCFKTEYEATKKILHIYSMDRNKTIIMPVGNTFLQFPNNATNFKENDAQDIGIDLQPCALEHIFDSSNPVSTPKPSIEQFINNFKNQLNDDENRTNVFVKFLLTNAGFTNVKDDENLYKLTNKALSLYRSETPRVLTIGQEAILARADLECFSLKNKNIWLIVENKTTKINPAKLQYAKFQLAVEMLAVAQFCYLNSDIKISGPPEIYGLRCVGHDHVTIFKLVFDHNYFANIDKFPLQSIGKIVILRYPATGDELNLEKDDQYTIFWKFLEFVHVKMNA